MRVRDILEKHGWRATHGPYYTDPREGKERELDVSATRSWTTKRKINAHLTLLIECKSASKSAQLLAAASKRADDSLYYHWLALDDDRSRAAIAEIVRSAHRDERTLMARLHAIAYPRERSIVTSVLVNAPRAKFRASATRDPNGNEAGPMWDATQKVFAAMNGTIITQRDSELDEMRQDLMLGPNTTKHADWVLRQAVENVLLFHPIVSIESPLMLVNDAGDTTNVPWCRVERGRVFGTERSWVDVVNADHLEAFAADLTAWYDRVLGRGR